MGGVQGTQEHERTLNAAEALRQYLENNEDTVRLRSPDSQGPKKIERSPSQKS